MKNNPSHDFVAGPTPCGQGGSTVSNSHSTPGTGAKNLMLVLTCEEERSGRNGMTGLWPELASKVDFAIVGEPTGMRLQPRKEAFW